MLQGLNIGSVNDFMTSGKKPLPEPLMIQLYVAIWI